MMVGHKTRRSRGGPKRSGPSWVNVSNLICYIYLYILCIRVIRQASEVSIGIGGVKLTVDWRLQAWSSAGLWTPSICCGVAHWRPLSEQEALIVCWSRSERDFCFWVCGLGQRMWIPVGKDEYGDFYRITPDPSTIKYIYRNPKSHGD